MDIYEKVVAIVAEQLGISTDDITAETTLEDLNADSLDVDSHALLPVVHG